VVVAEALEALEEQQILEELVAVVLVDIEHKTDLLVQPILVVVLEVQVNLVIVVELAVQE
jgi:hypothetical protein